MTIKALAKEDGYAFVEHWDEYFLVSPPYMVALEACPRIESNQIMTGITRFDMTSADMKFGNYPDMLDWLRKQKVQHERSSQNTTGTESD
jgi:hypothetical protein